MRCPNCSVGKHIVKKGSRNTKRGLVPRYRCMECGSTFSESINSRSHYSMKVILHSLELYDLGHSVLSIPPVISKRYKIAVPERTIYSWIERFENDLTFIKIRKKMKLDPERVIRTKNFQHRQVVPFSCHLPKLNIHSKSLPGLKRYINWVERSLPDRMFLEGPRMSNHDIASGCSIKELDTKLPYLTGLALERSSDPSPHSSVESFFLINDSSTIATEIPVFLNTDEIGTDVPITGHIDILQARFGRIYILDYKPNLNRPGEYFSQLHLYKEAVSKRMNIPKDKISTIVFNEHKAYEYILS